MTEFHTLITCSNNGVCVDGNQTFSCNCDPGYTGSMCTEKIDEYVESGCLNGSCTDLLNDYNCSCFVGWTGRNCGSRINYCVGSHPTPGPCNFVGSTQCISENSTFMCSCVIGFTGALCILVLMNVRATLASMVETALTFYLDNLHAAVLQVTQALSVR